VDHDGNVYVTGSSQGSGTQDDFAILKYNKNGGLEWVARYNNGGIDAATDIAVDANGNVYVTGQSQGSGTNFDYATVKYSAGGVQQWVRRYDAANLADRANAIAVDEAGHVYVTGSSTASIQFEDVFLIDYATIKYDWNGNVVWTKRYDREGNDQATDLAVDKTGNVYVTGSSGPPEEEPDNDFATVKYNAAGLQQWVAVYEGPGFSEGGAPSALELDAQGNIYVAGTNEEDYITLKYNPGGTEQWVRRFDGPGNESDFAADLAVDPKGNVHVTGSSRITRISDHDDYATIRYNTSGKQEWVSNYNSPSEVNAGLPDGAIDITVTDDGKIYVTGSSTNNRTSLDYTTILYNSNGSPRWTRHYNGEGNGTDQAEGLAADNAGNVYVTGWSRGNGTHSDFATIKYNSSGSVRWIKRFDGAQHLDDFASAIAVDLFGNVYVTGWTHISRTNTDFVTIKYDKDGRVLWVRQYNGSGNGRDNARAIVIDESGNVYVTGESEGAGTNTDFATIKYNSSGNQQWVIRYNGPTNGFDEAVDLALDEAGNVYVTGSSTGNAGPGIATVKYNNNGIEQWATQSDNGPSKEIAVDASGNAYVIGSNVVIKYNTSGSEQWAANFDRETAALVLDDWGNVYVTGWSYTDATNMDYATARYDNNGSQQWIIRYNGPGNWADQAAALALDNEGNVYVTGRSTGNGTDFDYATIKYEQSSVPVTRTKERTVPTELIPPVFRISHAPNPVVSSTMIQYELPEDGHVSITLYDALGRQVGTLVNASHKAGSYRINFDASRLQKGVFYYQVRVNRPKKQWTQTQVMIVMR
jgi:uncharacterized delta-60 repeat protein